VLSVVFDAPMSFTPSSLTAASVGQAATGLRVYPDYGHDKHIWTVLDRYDVETVNEEWMEWIDQIIIWCPRPPRPTLPDQLTFGAHPRLNFASEAGVDYLVQSWDDLGVGTPTTFQRVTGTGGPLTIEDTRSATVMARFYRVVPAQESLWEGLRGTW